MTGAPTFAFDVGGAETAAYQEGSGTGTLVFSYQVMPDDSDSNGIAWAADALSLVVDTSGGGMAPTTTVAVQGALSDHKVNGAQTASGTATVSTVTVTSTPLLMAAGSTSADTYGVGETIEFTVTFSAAVTVIGGPEFAFCLGTESCTSGSPPPGRRLAALSSGSGTTALVFRYTVVATDVDTNGIWVGNQSRTLKLDADEPHPHGVRQQPPRQSHPYRAGHEGEPQGGRVARHTRRQHRPGVRPGGSRPFHRGEHRR